MFARQVFHIVRVTVDVLSVNRHAPRFPTPRVQLDVPANSPPGTVWSLPAADDPDGGVEGVQTYRIAPAPPTTTSTFRLDVVVLPDGSREIQLRLLQSLNRSVFLTAFSARSTSYLMHLFCIVSKAKAHKLAIRAV